MAATETIHATSAQIVAISSAHGVSDAKIVARVVAVHAAIKSGVTVKTLAGDLKAAGATNPEITVVNATTLGTAKAAGDVILRSGLSIATAQKMSPAAIVQSYRAIMRHGVKGTVPAIVDAGIKGDSPESKLANIEGAATESVDASIEDRAKKTSTSGRVSPAASTPADVLAQLRISIGQGRLELTDALMGEIVKLAQVATEVHAAKRKTTAPAAKTPATV